MGVPALFRWLSQNYPKITSPAIEEQPHTIEGHEVPVDATKPNPNGEEFDNLYLDMNGVVHNSVHPEGKPQPANEAEMILNIFEYTDRIVNLVRPRKVLMIAVDGVAPRAKMNQQRSRRFRSAQEAEQKYKDKLELLKMLKSQNGGAVDEAALLQKSWDTNSITPGTPFMTILAESLRYWVAYKLNTDPMWETLKVIISDASVVGEGEHKIMNFVRSQRRSPQYDPNTRHVIYGLDADLIMLGLGTHEPYFRILREDVFHDEAKKRTCHLCGQPGHYADQCRGELPESDVKPEEKEVQSKPFIWLHIPILREYLEVELHVSNLPFKYDFERAIDDWVFMCFFIGNDFLPHLPALDIREGAINILIALWKECLPLMGGFLTRDGEVNLARAQHILTGLAKQEDTLFKRRKEGEDRRDAGIKRRKLEQNQRSEITKMRGRLDKKPTEGYSSMPIFIPEQIRTHEVVEMTNGLLFDNPFSFQSQGGPTNTAHSSSILTSPPSFIQSKRKTNEFETPKPTPDKSNPQNDSPEPSPDNVRLWEEGYADRYYTSKFHVDPRDILFRQQVADDYALGLCWVMRYYYQDCASWQWFYPHHYAPFASDFSNLEKLATDFEKDAPSKPYEQLMSVMPSSSKHTLPPIFHSLMTSPESEIADFYPTDFEIDLNGKKWAHQGVVLLSFIDEKRLMSAMAKKYPLLSEEEILQNETGKEVLLFSNRHPLYDEVIGKLYAKTLKNADEAKLVLRSKITEGLAGIIARNEIHIPGIALRCPLIVGDNDSSLMPDLEHNNSMSVTYEIPKSKKIHKSILLPGVRFPEKVLTSEEREKVRNGGLTRGGREWRRRGGNQEERRRISGNRFQGGFQHGNGGQNGDFATGDLENGGYSGFMRYPVPQQKNHAFTPENWSQNGYGNGNSHSHSHSQRGSSRGSNWGKYGPRH